MLWYAFGFAAAQELGLLLRFPPAEIALYWPAAGLAIAVFALAPGRFVPALALTQVAVNTVGNVVHGRPFVDGVVFGLVNVVPPLIVAAVAHTRRGARLRSTRTSSDLVLLMALSASTLLVSAALGVIALSQLSDDTLRFWPVFRNWWAADAAGVLAITPLVLSVANGSWRRALRRPVEFALAEAAVVLLTVVVFLLVDGEGITSMRSFVLVALLWPALRFGTFGPALALAPTVTLVVLFAHEGYGPFPLTDSTADAVLDAQVYVLCIGAAALIAGAGADTIRRSAEALTAREADRRAARRTALVNRLATSLAGAATRREIADVLHAQGGRCVDADDAFLAVVVDEAVTLFHGDAGASGGGAAVRVLPLDGTGPATDSIRSGHLVLLPDLAAFEARYPLMYPEMADSGLQALACVPLHDVGGRVGGGSLVFAWKTAQRFERDVVETLPLVGELVDQAVVRAVLFETERNLRKRAEGLEAVAAALTSAVTVADVARVVVDVGLAAVSTLGAVARVHEQELQLLAPTHPDLVAAADYDGMSLATQAPIAVAASTGRTVSVSSLEEMRERFPDGAARMERLGLRRAVAVPVAMQGRVGAVIVAGTWDEPLPGDDLVAYVEALADLCGQAIERAQHYEQQHRTAEVLQRSLLGELPVRDDVRLAARYLPAVDGLEVGGDWFDALETRLGSLLVVVGDVVGRGLVAASTMGQLRSATRSLALADPSPGRTLLGLDRFVEHTPDGLCATIVCLELEVATGRVRYASAGHPPPLVVGADGTTRFLEGGRRGPLGVRREGPPPEAADRLRRGDRVVLYSDGLIERRRENLDVGFARVRTAAHAHRHLDGLAFIDAVVHDLAGEQRQNDDLCVLTVECLGVLERFDWALRAPRDLGEMRRAFSAWLQEREAAGFVVEHQHANDLVLAVNEACTNALEHGCRDDRGATVVLSAEVDAGGVLVVQVQDPGRWLPRDEASFGGRGLGIIESLVDRLTIAPGGEGRDGTLLELEARLQPSSG